MDAYEATKIVFSRIQNLDPENASKIMGLLLIQDHGDKEMIRLAFGPEALVHSVILKARKDLGISSNTPSSTTPSTPSSPSPFLPNNNQTALSLSRQNSSSSSSRLGTAGGINLPSPLSIPNPNSSSTTSWAAAASGFSNFQNPDDLISPNSSSPFYGNGDGELIDEFQLQDQLSFLNDGPKSQDLFYPPPQELASSPNGNLDAAMLFSPYGGSAAGCADWGGGSSVNGLLPHRRSCSVSDICLGSSDDSAASGFGWKPCLYFARGYCKNGTSCRFLHGGGLTDPAAAMVGSDGVAANLVGSPSKLDMMEQCQELLRSKSAQQQQQQRLAAASQLMAASASFPYSASKCMNFLLQQHQQQNDSQRAAAAALMMGEDIHKFGRSRLERNHFAMNGVVDMNPGSRQIYLTFPADSTFREEDVSNYFSIYGPVQDVRIPYQQKRMFGFVTFVYSETVKIILAKGNPHFVCDARVLVKPYKEKGKVPDKKQQQQVERGEYSACNSPTGLEARDPYDLQIGPRMYYNTQDMLWRRKLEEQADLQQALELQSRRLMGLQLLDVKKHHHHRTLSTGGAPIGSPPIHSPNFFNQSLVYHSDRSSPESPEENCSSPAMGISAADQQVQQIVNVAAEKELTGSHQNGKESPHNEDSDLQESLEHNLPDSPFASPTKAALDYMSAFSNAAGVEGEKNYAATTNGGSFSAAATSANNNNLITSSLLPASSTLDVASFKSCYFQMPRFSSGHGAIGM